MSRSNRDRSDGDDALPGDWNARHARTGARGPDAVRSRSVVRFEAPTDDWGRRHARTRTQS